MNDDRCYHVSISEGQKMCSCQDYIVWMRTVIEVQAEYILDLERRMREKEHKVILDSQSDGMVD